MTNWRKIVSLLGVAISLLSAAAGTFSSWSTPIDRTLTFSKQIGLSELTDGAYQFCTEPDPKDWTDGAGICLNLVKEGQYASGYYGYPHSSHFICLRGELLENSLVGEALFIVWSAHQWTDFPQGEFSWDVENRLILENGILLTSRETDQVDTIRWVTFQQATLNTHDLYLYPSPRMTAPNQLCDWSVLPAIQPQGE